MMNKTLKSCFWWFLIVILFISTLGLFILIPIKHTISTTNIKEIITNIDIEEIVNNEAIENNLKEYLQPLLDEAEDFGIDEDIVIKVLNTNEIKGLVGDIAGNIVHYAITGENTKIITTKDIENILKTTIDDVDENIFPIKDEDKNKIINVFTENFPKYEELLPDTKMLESNLDSNVKTLINVGRFIVSNELILYLSIATVIALSGLIYLKKEKLKWVKGCTITPFIAAIISSILYSGIAIGAKVILHSEYAYIYNIIHSSINFGVIFNICMVLLMIAILVTFSILKKKKVIKG